MEKLQEQVVLIVSGVILFLLNKFWNWWQQRQINKKKANHSSWESITRLEKEVSHEEKKILWRYSAMRMFIIHFTNGTSTEAGLPLLKISFHHEVLEDYYVEPIARHYRAEMQMPSMFLSPMQHVFVTERHFIENVEAVRQDAQRSLKELNETKNPLAIETQQRLEYYEWLLGYNVKSVLWLGLKNKIGKIVAIQVIHWPATGAINSGDIPKISDMKKSIEEIYTLHNK